MTTELKRLYTFEEYLNYDDGTDKRYELEDGKLLAMPPASDTHEAIIMFLLHNLYREVIRVNLDWEIRTSGTGIRTTKNKTRLPDLILITPEQRKSIKGKSAILEVPPLLAVEVVSTESIRRDYNQKLQEYATFGIPEYWVVDPIQAKITVLTLTGNHYQASIFTGNQAIASPTFSELILIVDRVLAA